MRQILFNLLSNAVGFSLPGQTITVRARKSAGEVVFEVEDQGRGMPPEMMERVFDRFESQTSGTRHRGVGLGLSIVRSFVELHGGRVELTSAPGHGTTVTCVHSLTRATSFHLTVGRARRGCRRSPPSRSEHGQRPGPDPRGEPRAR